MLDALVLPFQNPETTIYIVQASDKESQAFETQLELLKPLGETKTISVSVTEGCTLVSVVAYQYLQQPGVYFDVLSLMHKAQIPVLQTSDSDYSISMLIPESELRRAVQLLHEKFELALEN